MIFIKLIEQLIKSVRIIGATPANDDGHSYFFTEDTYYRVDDKDSRVNYVGRISDDFLHCCKVETSRPNRQRMYSLGQKKWHLIELKKPSRALVYANGPTISMIIYVDSIRRLSVEAHRLL